LCTNLCSSISSHVFGVKRNVHVLVVVHGVGSAGALPALGSVRVAACARRSRRSDRCRLDMLAKGPWSARACLARARAALAVSRVAPFRFCVSLVCFVRVSALVVEGWRAAGWDGDPRGDMAWTHPLPRIRRGQKIYRTKNPEG